MPQPRSVAACRYSILSRILVDISTTQTVGVDERAGHESDWARKKMVHSRTSRLTRSWGVRTAQTVCLLCAKHWLARDLRGSRCLPLAIRPGARQKGPTKFKTAPSRWDLSFNGSKGS
ncbi:Uncharacterized protein TCM_008523 [Theobroma cacao]|uniref:Uncharacterized protein n=1 Tax=Theobroma cacao TaxID=3641 RepID=A0A061E453_THECC|nr:Uncharacterized protein TCM_008523 [Theobroma cacao]